jgi:hypothetical protein
MLKQNSTLSNNNFYGCIARPTNSPIQVFVSKGDLGPPAPAGPSARQPLSGLEAQIFEAKTKILDLVEFVCICSK